jgi:hypothetical protein
MSDSMSRLLVVQEALKEAIEAVVGAQYEKVENEYFFELNGESEFIASIKEDTIDFNLVTMKWVPGNYEPLVGSEICFRVQLEGLYNMPKEEMVSSLLLAINKLH